MGGLKAYAQFLRKNLTTEIWQTFGHYETLDYNTSKLKLVITKQKMPVVILLQSFWPVNTTRKYQWTPWNGVNIRISGLVQDTIHNTEHMLGNLN